MGVKNGSSNGALSAGGAGAAGVSGGAATLSGATRMTRHEASITAAPSSASSEPARRRTFAPARMIRVARVKGERGTGRRKSKGRRAICTPAPARRAKARASSAAGGPPC